MEVNLNLGETLRVTFQDEDEGEFWIRYGTPGMNMDKLHLERRIGDNSITLINEDLFVPPKGPRPPMKTQMLYIVSEDYEVCQDDENPRLLKVSKRALVDDDVVVRPLYETRWGSLDEVVWEAYQHALGEKLKFQSKKKAVVKR